MRKNNKARDITLHDFKLYHKTPLIKTTWFWQKQTNKQNTHVKETELLSHTIYKDLNVSTKTIKEFKTIKDLKDLSPLVLDEFKSWLIKQGKKNHNVNRLIQSIKTAIHRAEDWELIEKRSYSIVKKMKVPKGRILFYTPEEVKKLLQFVPDNWKVVVLLGSRAGLRRGEIANLQWKDIDFDKNILTIQSKENWHPKTYECRDIPIDTMLLKDDVF